MGSAFMEGFKWRQIEDTDITEEGRQPIPRYGTQVRQCLVVFHLYSYRT